LGLICGLLLAYMLVLLGRVVLSWFPLAPDGFGAQVYGLTVALTEPILGPLRRALPFVRIGNMGLDLSPIIVFFGIQILLGLLGCS
jgi:YggT family protein